MTNPLCTQCVLHKTARTNKLNSEYPKDYPIDLAFVAEAPGETEDSTGRPLVGAAGAIYNEALRAAGINRNTIYTSNIVRCRPPNNRTPKPVEIKACYQYTLSEIKYLRPKVIICLGLVAAKTILNDKTVKLGEAHGKVFTGNDLFGYECVIIPTWHPSPRSFIATPKRKQQMFNDIKVAKALVTRELNINKDWKSYGIFNLDSWNKVKPIFNNANIITVDIETTGLDLYDKTAGITNIGLACSEKYGVSIVCDEILPDGNIYEGYTGWTTTDYSTFLCDLKELLESKFIVGHGMKFDVKYIFHQLGIKVNNWYWDTSIGHSLVKPGDSNKLKDISWNYTNMGGYEYELAGGVYGGLSQTTGATRVDYNVGDVVCTHRIMNKQISILEKENKLSLAQQILIPAAQIFSDMEYKGIKINCDVLSKLDKEYQDKITHSRNLIHTHGTVVAYTKSKGVFNPNSSLHVQEILFSKQYCGYPIIRRTTTTNKPSTDKRTLHYLAVNEKSELCQLLIDYKKLSKLYSTYIKGIKPKLINGRIHTNYFLDVAITGRTSSSNVNLQNIPKDSDIKSMFEADEGCMFIDLDYKQMELVVSTYYTKDPIMVKAIQSGDAHTYLAKKIFGMTDVSDTNRRFIKTLNFGVLYGMGAGKLADALDISHQEAKSLISDYFKLLPYTQKWIAEQRKRAELYGYSKSLFNRQRYYIPKDQLKPGEIEDYNSAVNFPIQSCASDLMLYGMVQWKKYLVNAGIYGTKASMVLQVHDSVTTCTNYDVLKQLVLAKKAVFESTSFPFMSLPLTVDIEVGTNWGKTNKIIFS